MEQLRYSFLLAILLLAACKGTGDARPDTSPQQIQTIDFQEAAIIARANEYLSQAPVPITDFSCPRSEGGIHDFYSEGDYWWPDPDNPEGPYIRRDGNSNPDNFNAHRLAMVNVNRWGRGPDCSL